MRRLLFISLIAFAALAADARACSCVGAASGFPRAQGAFVGTIVAKHGPLDPRTGLVAYTFEVEKVYKGSYPRRVTLPSTLSEASCGMDRDVGFRSGVVLFGDWAQVGICSLISEEQLDDLAEPSAPTGPPPGAAQASLLGALLGTCWTVLGA